MLRRWLRLHWLWTVSLLHRWLLRLRLLLLCRRSIGWLWLLLLLVPCRQLVGRQRLLHSWLLLHWLHPSQLRRLIKGIPALQVGRLLGLRCLRLHRYLRSCGFG